MINRLEIPEIETDVVKDAYNRYKMFCKLGSKTDRRCIDHKKYLIDLLLNPSVDTVGKNIDDPTKWSIPDGEFQLLLNDLIIDKDQQNQEVQQAIQDIISKRFKAKHPVIGKFTAGKPKTKRKRRSTIKRKNPTNKGRKKSRKNKV
jgi:hypothetical protein